MGIFAENSNLGNRFRPPEMIIFFENALYMKSGSMLLRHHTPLICKINLNSQYHDVKKHQQLVDIVKKISKGFP